MITLKYETTVVKLGPLVHDFIDSGILVFFGMDAPEELAEFAILHEHTTLHAQVVAGDVIQINEDSYPVLCVGEVANENLSNLGHFIIKFNGYTEPEMPGDISVAEQSKLPVIEPGTTIKFFAGT